MSLKQKWIVLSAAKYSIDDEKTGKRNEGVSIRYLMSDNLNPKDDGNSKGLKPVKASLPIEVFSKIKEAPAIYDFDLDMVVVSDKPQLAVKDVNYVSPVALK